MMHTVLSLKSGFKVGGGVWTEMVKVKKKKAEFWAVTLQSYGDLLQATFDGCISIGHY